MEGEGWNCIKSDTFSHWERVVAVAPKGHRFEPLAAIRLRDLHDEKLLFRTNCDMSDFLLENFRKQGIEPRIIYRSAREDWVQTMVAFGFGITIMPEFSHTDAATVARPLIDPDLVRQLLLVTVAGRRHEPATAAFVRAIRAHAWPEDNAPHPEPRALMFSSKQIRSMPGGPRARDGARRADHSM